MSALSHSCAGGATVPARKKGGSEQRSCTPIALIEFVGTANLEVFHLLHTQVIAVYTLLDLLCGRFLGVFLFC